MYPVIVGLLSLIALLAAGWVMWETKMGVPFGMAITMVKDSGEVQIGGGNILYLMEVTSAGAALGSPDTWHVAANLIDSKHVDKDSTKVTTFEDGSQVENRANRDVHIEGTFGQNSLTVHLFKSETKGKFYKVYYQDAPLANGKIKEYLYGIGQVFMDEELERKGETEVQPKFRVRINKNAAAITNANASLPTVKVTAAAMDLAIGDYFKVLET